MAAGLERRQFLKLLGWSGAALATGCAPEMPDLIPYVRPQENLVPGKASWFATTCRQCPSGCGVLAKNMDGRVIKLEGNPHHPLNRGRLCPRGQAALTALYHPDRLSRPMLRTRNGDPEPVQWRQAAGLLAERIADAGGRIAFLTPIMTGTLRDLIQDGLARAGAGPQSHIMYEPFALEAMRAANRIVFGRSELADYRLEEADFLISFGADFLEAWPSQVEYGRRFAAFHQPREEGKPFFVYVGPRRSLTAANADHMIYVTPGTEYLAAIGIIRAIMEAKDGNYRDLLKHWFGSGPPPERFLEQLAGEHTVQTAAALCGASAEELQRVARRLASARRPLALSGGNGMLSPHAVTAGVAANLICAMKPASAALIDFSRPHALARAASYAQVMKLEERMRAGQIELLLLYDTNPVFTLPRGERFAEAMGKVPHVVSFCGIPDETAVHAELFLPTHHFLEDWGDFQPRQGIMGLVQPAMGPLHMTRSLGDILIEAGFAPRTGQQQTFREVLQDNWRRQAPEGDFTNFWIRSLQQGGRWEVPEKPETATMVRQPAVPDTSSAQPKPGPGVFSCIVYPTIQFYDGRTAHSPWLQELPDPITQITWGGWVEMHPEDAAERGLAINDVVRIRSTSGSIRVPVLPMFTVPRGSLAVPIGQGHSHYGRFADALPDNPFRLLPDRVDENGQLPADALYVEIESTGERFALAGTSGSLTDHGRGFAVTVGFDAYRKAAEAGDKPHITLPLPEGYDPKVDVIPPHAHGQYRWAMSVDLDRCIGCGACVMACYAENNVAFVGRQQMLNMREMSWIRVQRYFEKDTWQVRWLVMMCQHCDSAPCEAVCPVFAPHHSEEGLNNQVYNRCFGTRFCSQNDPYKVRRFNWYTWKRPSPMDMQLNPDVTVRQKGVMEKCSFCIQRIVEAKVRARNENRLVGDGDFTTACAQTCPTGALIFGNLQDPQSRVSQHVKDPRAYQVLHHLNTKPAVIYLKRLTQEL
jgi:anaerobic selenocysteine-containing dehydrogenase/Fe-S-cluster-containing dehydrogenase component